MLESDMAINIFGTFIFSGCFASFRECSNIADFRCTLEQSSSKVW